MNPFIQNSNESLMRASPNAGRPPFVSRCRIFQFAIVQALPARSLLELTGLFDNDLGPTPVKTDSAYDARRCSLQCLERIFAEL